MPFSETSDAEKERLDPHRVVPAARTISDKKVQFRAAVLIEGVHSLVFPNKVSEHGFTFSATLPVHSRKIRHADDSNQIPLSDGASTCVDLPVSHEYYGI
jgi:hypothetical protein